MSCFSDRDIKRSAIICGILALSLFLIPFIANIAVKIILGVVLVLLVVNAALIVRKIILKKSEN